MPHRSTGSKGVLERAIGDTAIIRTGMPFRARPERELRRADVGVDSNARWEGSQDEDFSPGSPEIVIEVEAPSNTAREFQEKQSLCLATGAISFWVVYPDPCISVGDMAKTQHRQVTGPAGF